MRMGSWRDHWLSGTKREILRETRDVTNPGELDKEELRLKNCACNKQGHRELLHGRVRKIGNRKTDVQYIITL